MRIWTQSWNIVNDCLSYLHITRQTSILMPFVSRLLHDLLYSSSFVNISMIFVSQLRLEKLSARHRYLESNETLQINILISVSEIRIGTRNDIMFPILNNCIRIIILVLKDSSFTPILISSLFIVEKLSNLTSYDHLMLNFFSYFRLYFTFGHPSNTDILWLNGLDTCPRGAEVMFMWTNYS